MTHSKTTAAAGAIDARALVAVTDAHGGVTVYDGARPTFYLMAGEWYPARTGLSPPPATREADVPPDLSVVIEIDPVAGVD